MKKTMLKMVVLGMTVSLISSCAIFGGRTKRGCPTNSSSMGAERVLAGEKPAKKQKFKVKQMN